MDAADLSILAGDKAGGSLVDGDLPLILCNMNTIHFPRRGTATCDWA
jgi:hypothetical protein